jgi:alpha-mannosidase
VTSRLRLVDAGGDTAVALLETRLPPLEDACALHCEAPAGALIRIDGIARGAFDREHSSLDLEACDRERALLLEVERRSLPTNGLPAGPGLKWSWMLGHAAPAPPEHATLGPAAEAARPPESTDPLRLWGHSHLDVAWLWSFDATRRKAMRTFATAVALLERDETFVFAQSQPQLYDYVREGDGELFARVRELAVRGRFDPDIAAMWVEPDCNIPSGESLLRQLLFANRYCREHFATMPSIAWLPDTFGFARTLPTLLAHAGIPYFATTKLYWNDTTEFPLRQFRWRGPDGSEVVAASLRGMDGGFAPWRVAAAHERNEPLVVGYGDGGGGPTSKELHEAPAAGRWERPRVWFERLAAQREQLPVHDDELYLEYHRGVFTTHRDVKAANARLERRLGEIETAAAWCVALGVPKAAIERVTAATNAVWEVALRNQFHDVLPGTSIAEVYVDARTGYADAETLLDSAETALRAMLPRARPALDPRICAPQFDGSNYVFEHASLSATVTPAGALVDAHVAGGRNVVRHANVPTLYRDRPRKWEAWNVDAGYWNSAQPLKAREAAIVDGALEIRLDAGRSSHATMLVSLHAGDPFVRIEMAIDWHERRRLLRVEHDLHIAALEAVYGAPHGVVRRSTRFETPAERARFEVPGQRFAYMCDQRGDGFASFALDTYGWSGRMGKDDGMLLGHSLLRGTAWPDPGADLGEHTLAWAVAPTRNATLGGLEAAWRRFARLSGVPLFDSGDESIVVEACKPAEDGDGVVVRVRECDGDPRGMLLRCGARMREAVSVDALERPLDEIATIDGEAIVASIGPYALRSFRVRFR